MKFYPSNSWDKIILMAEFDPSTPTDNVSFVIGKLDLTDFSCGGWSNYAVTQFEHPTGSDPTGCFLWSTQFAGLATAPEGEGVYKWIFWNYSVSPYQFRSGLFYYGGYANYFEQIPTIQTLIEALEGCDLDPLLAEIIQIKNLLAGGSVTKPLGGVDDGAGGISTGSVSGAWSTTPIAGASKRDIRQIKAQVDEVLTAVKVLAKAKD